MIVDINYFDIVGVGDKENSTVFFIYSKRVQLEMLWFKNFSMKRWVSSI